MTERFANVETMVEFVKKYTPCINGETTMECVERSIRHAPTIEVVPKELYEQILWERNIAMEQLEEHGIGFAAKKKNEVEAKPVVHAHWEGDTCSHCKLQWKENMCDDADDWGYFDPMPDYCCNCGAQMDEVAGDINVGTKKE